jgi:putative NADH-flavin reductase
MMKIAIFGATGGTGRALVEQALAQGHTVTAFARNSSALAMTHSRLSVVQGDVLNPARVEAAVVGQDAVLNSLGMKPGTQAPVTSEGTRNIVAAMQKFGVRRLITQSSLPVAAVDGNPHELPWPFRIVLSLAAPLKTIFQDKLRQEQIIQRSGLEWVIVRPAALTDGARTGTYRVGTPLKVSLSSKISRADVAEFMLTQTVDNTYLHQVPRLSY